MARIGCRRYIIKCVVCRKRKVKCDGTKPSCERCRKGGIVCLGYERPIDFAYFDGQTKDKLYSRQPGDNAPSAIPRVPDTAVGSRRQPLNNGDRFVVLPYSPGNLAISQFKAGFVAVLYDRYLPKEPKVGSRGEAVCAGWIASACDLSSFEAGEASDMLSDSLLAMALTFAGKDRKNPDICTASLRHYSKALMGLRRGLAIGPRALSENQVDMSLITCLACAMYEMTSNKSFTALVHHLQGVGAILKDNGVENLQSSTSRRVFWEYRVMEITISLITRRSSFLSLAEWLNPSWRPTDPHDKNPLQTLLDVALQIPSLMERFDTFSHLTERDISVNASAIRVLAVEALTVQESLKDWKNNLCQGDKKSQLYIPRCTSEVNITGDIHESGNVFSISYEFPGFDLASALIFYEAIQIFLYGFLVQMVEYDRKIGQALNVSTFATPPWNVCSLNTQSLECANRICQSVDYFFKADKRIIGRVVMMFPFESSRALYARMAENGTGNPQHKKILLRKLQFCDTVVQRFRDEGLPTWVHFKNFD